MESVYRRHKEHTKFRNRSNAVPVSGYKQKFLQHALFCLLLFLFFLFIKSTPQNQYPKLKESIRFILTTQTDFAALPGETQDFIKHYFKTTKENIPRGKDVLTALIAPVRAPITSPFGMRTHPETNNETFHYGIDLGAPEDEKIKCAADGKAIETGNSEDYGLYILVQHPDEVYTLYAHCKTLLPQPGDDIQAGQVIATVGATGNATGPHLHFELRNGETYLDPAEFISFQKGDSHD